MTGFAMADLRVVLTGSEIGIAEDLSFSARAGEIVGLVGESGSGKTTVGTALLNYARRGATIASGSVAVRGRDMLKAAGRSLQGLRGQVVSYVPQDPGTALNPALRIGRQLKEVIETHEPGLGKAAVRDRVLQSLADVNLPAEEAFLTRFPHQLSGGQQQRVCLAMAFLLKPDVIVLDEPTTGLDVITQAHVLRTVRTLCDTHKVAALYVTHDLAVVRQLADRVLVMYAGQLAEAGTTDEIFAATAHPYTARLIAAIPEVDQRRRLETIPGFQPPPGSRGAGCPFEPRCVLAVDLCRENNPPPRELTPGHVSRCHRATEVGAVRQAPQADPAPGADSRAPVLEVRRVGVSYGKMRVLGDVSLTLGRQECLAVVGGSGSGKTTLARAIIGLTGERSGDILLNGEPVGLSARARSLEQRRRLQYVFQNPYSSLNPRKTIEQSLQLPLRQFFGIGPGDEARTRLESALERVNLTRRTLARYPDQLSGGERQRVAIARALICEPDVIVCDEITSALDVSVQAAITNLLQDLQRSEHLSMVFITHNLGLVRSIADRVAVMHAGELLEVGSTEHVLQHPTSSYTRELLANTPTLRDRRAA